jgi:hypothetical protein
MGTLSVAEWWLEAKNGPANLAHFAGPAQCRVGLTFTGVIAWITSLYGETRQESEAAPEACERQMVRHKEGQNVLEQVRSRHRQAKFLHQSFEILFCGLLAVETLLVRKWFRPPSDYGGELKVALGLADPLPRGSFHRGLCPGS